MSAKFLATDVFHTDTNTAKNVSGVRNEASLLKTGALQSAIFNSANFSSIATDAKGVIQVFNVGAERMLGYTAAEVMNKITLADISDPKEDIARAEALSIELGTPTTPGFEALVFKASRGIEDICDLTYIRKDGSRFPAVVSVTALRDYEHEIIGYLMISINNSALKNAEEALRENDRKHAYTMGLSQLFEWEFDVDSGLFYFSDHYYSLHGTSSDREGGNFMSAADFTRNFVHPDDALIVGKEIAKAIATVDPDYVSKHEARIYRRDGELRHISVVFAITKDAAGRTIKIRGANQDISERKRAEEESRKASALQSAIFNSANFSSIATDAKGVIQIFNVGAERMLGYTAAEVMNKITPADISDSQEVIARAKALSAELETPITPGFEALVFKASRGIEDIYELTYIRKDGSRFPAVVSVTALRDAQDAIIGYLLIGTDNTARKQAEEALLKAGALQSAIFNSANFSSIATDAKGVIQIFNVGAERMLGYTADEVMNKITPADISDPQEVIFRAEALSLELDTPITPGFEALVFKASRGIEDIYELTYIRKDGSRFPAVVSVTALRDAQDTIIGYLLIGTDNTARKKAEEALLKAGALQSAIFNSANFSSIATDAKGVIQIFNVGAERMLGYTAAEVMNKITPADISDPQEVIARAKALSAELETSITPGFEALVFKASRGIEDIYELTYIRKDGSRFPAVVSVTALRDEQDAIIGYLLIGTDNTARKQIEAEQMQLSQRLRDHQFYTRSLFECNIDAIMTTDPSCIITDVNKQMELLTGCTRDELIGAPFKNYFTDPDRAERSIKQVLNEKKVTNYELTARARDGKETVVSFNATTFYDRDRKLQGVFAAARDVTERKRLDQVLQEKNVELESAKSVAEKTNLAKSDFLANMSHELRTPLNSVIGFSEVLQDRIFGEINEKQQEYIGNILTSGRHLLSLINDILDLSKVESGKMMLELSSFSLRETVDASLMMLMEKALKGGIALNMELAPEADVIIVADQRKLKQILYNLLSNAVKFTPTGGNVDVSAVKSGDFIEITVADSGIGIKEEDIAKLFHPFTQLESAYTKEYEGTGLGLALNRHLVELHGGRVWVESRFGAGSRFSFSIPMVQAAAQQMPTSNRPEQMGDTQVEEPS